MKLLPNTQLIANHDMSAVRVVLSSEHVFVWTRIEPHSTVSDICAISGMPESKTIEILRFLCENGLVQVEEPSAAFMNHSAFSSISIKSSSGASLGGQRTLSGAKPGDSLVMSEAFSSMGGGIPRQSTLSGAKPSAPTSRSGSSSMMSEAFSSMGGGIPRQSTLSGAMGGSMPANSGAWKTVSGSFGAVGGTLAGQSTLSGAKLPSSSSRSGSFGAVGGTLAGQSTLSGAKFESTQSNSGSWKAGRTSSSDDTGFSASPSGSFLASSGSGSRKNAFSNGSSKIDVIGKALSAKGLWGGQAANKPASTSGGTLATKVDSAPTMNRPVARKLPDFNGVDPRDAIYLRSVGQEWCISGEPLLLTDGRYCGVTFDKQLLLVHCDLTIEQRRKLLVLNERFNDFDLFSLLEIEPTEDAKAIKKAYFQFSRQMHPDAYFGKELGQYKEIISRIFKAVSERQERLAADDLLRKIYARAVKARNEAYRQILEGERLMQQQQAQEAEKAQLEAKKNQAEQRKLELQEKLSAQYERKRQQLMSPFVERAEKSKSAFEEGKALEKAGNFAQAATMYQRAMLYDANTPEYKVAYERCLKEVNSAKAEALWKEGNVQESVGSMRDAVMYYQQAVQIFPRASYLAHLIDLLLPRIDDKHYLAELAQKAVDLEPHVAEHWRRLGQVFEQAKLLRKAQSAYEKALQLDPKNELVKKALRALNRP